MHLRNTIIALLLLLLVGGYSLIVLLGSRPVPPPTLLNLDSKHISGIDLRYADSALELVSHPNHTVALVKPSVTLTVTSDNKGVMPALLVGHISPVSNSVYVKLANQPAVLMTTGDFTTAITKKVNDLRTHELISFNMDDAEQIVLHSGTNKPIEIDKQGGQWRIVAPGHYAAAAHTVAQILTALVDAHIADFVTDAPKDLAQYGLQNPQIEVSVSGKDKVNHSLLFGLEQPRAAKKAVYVKRAGDN